MLTLGEELLLVALDADKGVLLGSAAMRVGLNAAGLAELLAAGTVRLRQADGRPGVTVVAGDDSPVVGHPLLAETLQQARDTRPGDRHPERCLKNWVAPSLFAYLGSLREQEILTWDRPTRAATYGRLRLLDAEAAAAARARVERVAAGAVPNERDRDLAAIVHGLGLDKTLLYKGRRNRSKRQALATALEGQRLSLMVARVLPEIPGQKFTFDSKNDLAMAMRMSETDRTP